MASSARRTIPKNNNIRIHSMLLIRGILVVFGSIYIILMVTTTQRQYKGENSFTGSHPLPRYGRVTSPTGHDRTNQKSHRHIMVVGSAVEENLIEFRLQRQQPHGIESHEKPVVATTRWSNNSTQMMQPKHLSAWPEEYPVEKQTPKGHSKWILPKTDLVRADATSIALAAHQPNLTGPASLATDTLASFFNASTWNDTTLDDETSLLAQLPLPDWMKRYLMWHRQKRRHMQIHGSRLFKQERWLVVQCLGEHDSNCGGTADRLKPLPWALRVAHNTKRILLIHWTKPGHLEEFLLPPQGGMDWRAPPWLAQMLQNRTWGKLVVPGDQIRAYAAGPKTLIRSRFQSYSGGSHWYNSQLSEPGEAAFEQVFHNVWTMLFTPSPPLATMIQNELHRMGLHPGQYVASHLRALYNREDRPEDQSRNWAENAVNCASELQPGVPMFFASDSPNATFYAKQYATAKRVPVFGTREPHPNPPLHLDRTKDWRRRPISDFYDSFVDLYLMALGSGCVTYNKGGYGHMGLMMGVNSSCALPQDALDKPVIHNPCHWSGGGSSNPTTGVLSLSESSSQKLMFFRPMED